MSQDQQKQRIREVLDELRQEDELQARGEEQSRQEEDANTVKAKEHLQSEYEYYEEEDPEDEAASKQVDNTVQQKGLQDRPHPLPPKRRKLRRKVIR